MIVQKQVTLFCVDCGKEPTDVCMRCPCGGMIETAYDAVPSLGRQTASAASFLERFWPVLPLRHPPTMYADLPLIAQTVHATRLQRRVGGPPIWLQNETTLLTGTTKDRAAATVFPFFQDFGIREFVLSSTGNTSTSFAALARLYPAMRVHIFVGKDFAYRLRHIASDNVVTHIVNGNFVQAGDEAKAYATQNGLFWEGGFFNPARRDGLKTAFLEAALTIGEAPAFYIQAISSAMGVVGAAKAARELSLFGIEPKMPRLICVQQDSCAPMVAAWEEHSPRILAHHKVEQPHGIAKAILRGDPSAAYPIVYLLVQSSGGQFLAASTHEIKQAQALVYETENIWICEAAACAVAGYLKLLQQEETGTREMHGPVVINLTGGDRHGLSD